MLEWKDGAYTPLPWTNLDNAKSRLTAAFSKLVEGYERLTSTFMKQHGEEWQGFCLRVQQQATSTAELLPYGHAVEIETDFEQLTRDIESTDGAVAGNDCTFWLLHFCR